MGGWQQRAASWPSYWPGKSDNLRSRQSLLPQRKLTHCGQRIGNMMGKLPGPQSVYTHSNNDSHQDHAAVTNAVIATTRKNDCSLYMYEQTIPGGIAPNPFRGQYYVDVSDTIMMKLDSIMAHRTQLDTYGPWWLEGVKGRAMYYGFKINVKYAEIFEVIKDIALW